MRAKLILILATIAGHTVFPCAMRAAGEETPAASPAEELQATVDIIRKAPLVLILATSQHQLDKRRWPDELHDITYVLESNVNVLPKGFSYRKVTFTTVSRRECEIGFSFDWPALEGGVATGTIRVQSGGALKDMAKTAKVTWARPPKLRADLQPSAAESKPAANSPSGESAKP